MASRSSQANVALAYTSYSFDVAGDALDPTTQLFFDFSTDGSGFLLDQVSVTPTPGPAVESASGSIAFADVDTGDTHTATHVPQSGDYVGTFSLDPVSESGGSVSLVWHYDVNNSDIQFLSQGQQLTQTYTVFVTDDHGASAGQDVTVVINGLNDTPTVVSKNIITDVGANGTVDIPAWALAANDTDPDALDHVFVNALVSSSGGTAVPFIDAFFIDDATPGGSFTYTSSDGIATSNEATATVINNATSVTALVGTGGDDIIIANNGTESVSGGGGNDVLIGNSGSHIMTGGRQRLFRVPADVRRSGHHHGLQQSDRARPSRDLRQRFWRRADRRHGHDVHVRKLGGRPVLGGRRRIPLR